MRYSTIRITRLKLLLITIVLLFTAYGCQVPEITKERTGVELKQERRWCYEALIFDIAPITSCSPDIAALNYVRNSLHDYGICDKENIVFRLREEIPYVSLFAWDYPSLLVFEDVYREPYDKWVRGSVRVIFVCYLKPGLYRMDHYKYRALRGVQYSHNSIAIFKDYSAGAEGAVLLHEFMHAFKLCWGRQKPKYHCANPRCLMHPFIESPYSTLCTRCKVELSSLVKKVIADGGDRANR